MPNRFGTETLASMEPAWTKMLDMMADGRLSGQGLKQSVMFTFAALTKQDAYLLAKIINKHLEVNVSVATINKVFPGLITKFGCMLADKFEGNLGQGMYGSLKLDGLRNIITKETPYTRNGHIILGLKHITDQLRGWPALDGELTIPGAHFQYSSGKVRSHAACPQVWLNVFDLPEHEGTFEERLEAMQALPWDSVNQITLVKHVLMTSLAQVQRNMDKAISSGYEGLVLKTPNHLYQTKRSKDWMKIKLVESEDLPVVGTFEGEGKYVGMIGGLKVLRPNGVIVGVGSGLSDAQRKQDPSDFIGLTAEVLYHEITPDGSLRHPRLKCFRGDK